jgi:hypothetical protein
VEVYLHSPYVLIETLCSLLVYLPLTLLRRTRLQCAGTCAESSFRVWMERTSPYCLTEGINGRQFNSLLAAGLLTLSPSLPLLRTDMCHHIVIELYLP